MYQFSCANICREDRQNMPLTCQKFSAHILLVYICHSRLTLTVKWSQWPTRLKVTNSNNGKKALFHYSLLRCPWKIYLTNGNKWPFLSFFRWWSSPSVLISGKLGKPYRTTIFPFKQKWLELKFLPTFIFYSKKHQFWSSSIAQKRNCTWNSLRG